MKISLCMIVKDEEAVLARCLESTKRLADEMVIVDTGSSDGTLKIAKRYTNKIFSYPWKDDFASARNFAFSKGTGDYLLWLDADDVLPPESLALIPAIRRQLEETRPDAVFCPYKTGELVYLRERFLRRAAGFLWQGRVHECIAPRGNVVRADFAVVHLGSHKIRGARNLRIYQKWAAEERLTGRDLFYYGRELYYNRLCLEAIAVLRAMLDGEGWHVNKIEACKILARCHLLQNEREQALSALFRSFLYGEPRASVLCEIAAIFRLRGEVRTAVFWYETALVCKDFQNEGDFETPLSRTLVPLVELTCCYHALGEKDKALAFQAQAEALFPNHPTVLANRAYFNAHP